jgi:hypothetical protein
MKYVDVYDVWKCLEKELEKKFPNLKISFEKEHKPTNNNEFWYIEFLVYKKNEVK